jgi:dolichol-phosphate mannosyltransferase
VKIVIVLPTYNERENLGPLLEALQEQFPAIPHDMHVLVVDDNSPDGTGEVGREAAARWGNIHLLTGPKRGLGVAYVRGIEYALRELAAEAVVQMDADFSHNPADLPRLVAALDEGADMVIGSRYIKGGQVPGDWGPLRRTMSLVANLGVRFIAGLFPVRDCTNGFRVISAGLLRRFDLTQEPPRGYVILVYLVYQALRLGAHVREVPVSFSNRAHGTSKLRLSDALEFFANLWWIRYDRPARFYGLALGGISGMAANIAAIVVLKELAGLPLLAASALAIEVSILYSFAWRDFWALAARRGRSSTLWRLALYHIASAPPSLLTLATFAVLVQVFDVHYLVAQAAGIAPALIWNYALGERLLGRLWTGFSLRARGVAGQAVDRPAPDGS